MTLSFGFIPYRVPFVYTHVIQRNGTMRKNNKREHLDKRKHDNTNYKIALCLIAFNLKPVFRGVKPYPKIT